jgi:transposase
LAKPWTPRNGNRFAKTAFSIDLDHATVRCPENRVAPIRSLVAHFAATDCDRCPSRDRCTRAAPGRGRSVSIHPDERMLLQLRTLKSSSEGRKILRQRVAIEHALAHVVRRQGPRARYIGVRKNVLDLRRVCAVENLLALDRQRSAA